MAQGSGNSYQVGTTAAASVARRVLNTIAQATGFAPFARAAFTTTFGGNADVTYSAQQRGAAGNLITIQYVVAGNNTPLSVTVSGNAVTVNLATSAGGAATSTAAQVVTAVQGNAAANTLVRADIAAGQTGAGVPVAMAPTLLSGGATANVGLSGSSDYRPKAIGQGIPIHNSYN